MLSFSHGGFILFVSQILILIGSMYGFYHITFSSCSLFLLVLILFCTFFAILLLSLLTTDFAYKTRDHKIIQLS